MKTRSFLFNLTLGVLTSFCFVSPASIPFFKVSPALTQETSASCPLPQEIAVTFLDSKCEEIKLTAPQSFYRYYSQDSMRYGRYLTTDRFTKNVDVIRNLALKQEWGNKATTMITVTLPAGTTIYKGIVAPQEPTQCYPGMGVQVFIKDTRDPNIQWSAGESITVEPFSCP